MMGQKNLELKKLGNDHQEVCKINGCLKGKDNPFTELCISSLSVPTFERILSQPSKCSPNILFVL